MKKLALLVLASLLTALSSHADVIFQDLFPYPDGEITNTSGGLWILHSGSGNGNSFVKNNRYEVSSSSGGNGLAPIRQDDVHRNFSITNNSSYTNVQQVLYASFIINFTNLPSANGAYFAHFQNGLTTQEGKLWALIGSPTQITNNFTVQPNTFRLGVSMASGTGATGGSGSPSKTFPIDLALNTDYQVVLGWNPTLNASSDGYLPFGETITLWINPVSPADPSVVTTDAFTPSSSNIAQSFTFRQASGFGGFTTISNLVISTTFPEAATNVYPTNAVAPKFAYQPVIGITNFVGSSVTLSAVAVGQGQASLTYQWQTNGVNIVNPAGNTNVLLIDGGSAQTNDSANYTLVVTTPYGLSTTSSVSKVLISPAKIPPVFLTQPVSQTVYKGQNVVLSTTVSSPGNVTFTWFSNNVVVTAGQSDSPSGSTLTLNSVVTNYSATYKVAATNDFAGVPTNGVVSTNAVLTVVNPPVVTVAFLRSLVDPTTFQPTNSTLPYQVTGTITTFTNLTSGTTSSYFLQDGTAGINIFVTGDSNFRPAQGDVVTFVGIMSSFTSGLELEGSTTIPYTSWTDTGTTNALPAPIVAPFTITNGNLATVSYTIAGSRVELTNVFFGTHGGTVISNTVNQNVAVTNASGQTFVLSFFDLDGDTAGQTLPTSAASVTGIMYGNVTNYTLAVTRFADIVTNSPVVLPIPLNFSLSGQTFTLTWSDPTFTLQFSTNVAGPYVAIPSATSPYPDLTTNAAGFYRLFHP